MTRRLLSLLALFPSVALAAPGNPPGPTQPPPVPWSTSVFADGGADHGSYASMATTTYPCIAPGGGFSLCHVIGVAHHNKTNGDLMYSSSLDQGRSWTTQTADAGAGGDIVGTHASLTFNGSQPLISYHNATDSRLMFAKKVSAGTGNCGTSLGWDCRSLGSGGLFSSIALNGSGVVFIAHSRSGGRVFLTNAPAPYSSSAFVSQEVVSDSVRSLKLAIDDINRPHLAWATGDCIRYTHALFEEIETVECSPSNPTFDAGRISMVINISERPHLAYLLNTSSGGYSVRHAYKSDQFTWNRQHVSFVSLPAPATSIVLATNEIDTDSIAWGYTSSGVPRLVVATPGGIFGWTGVNADSPGGAHSSMLRLVSGQLAVAHYDPVGRDLRFTKHD